jgi:hypothetical protein
MISPGLIILIVVGIVFLAGIIGSIVVIVKGPALPAGLKFEAVDNGNKATVIFDEAIAFLKDPTTKEIKSIVADGSIVSIDDITKACASAITTTELAFGQMGISKANLDEVIFVIKTDQRYEKEGGIAALNSAAYSVEIVGFLGIKRKQVAVIRVKYAKTMVTSGEPAIHELVHILDKTAGSGYDTNHANIKLWDNFGQNTVQAISDNLWLMRKNSA